VNDGTRASFLSSIIYRDDHIIAINKGYGMAVQGGDGQAIHIDGMLHLLKDRPEDERPKLIHRLDKDTTGVLLIARTRLAAASFANLLTRRSNNAIGTGNSNDHSKGRSFLPRDNAGISKHYWAVTHGAPTAKGAAAALDIGVMGAVSEPLRHIRNDFTQQRLNNKNNANTSNDEFQREQVVLASDPRAANHRDTQQSAVSTYQIMARNDTHNLTWLEMSPLTGRKHQLRVHSSDALHAPILVCFITLSAW
jgi:23S rRNA-/tRNA-specific pseudouridylate synthase